MKGFFLFWLLTMLLGNPLLALIVLLVAFWLLDRSTWRILPDPRVLFHRHNRQKRCERDIAVNPGDVDARLELAKIYLDRGRPKEALAQLASARPRLEGVAEADFVEGLAHLRAGDPAAAIEPLGRSLKLDPGLHAHEALLRLAEARAASGDRAGAGEAFDRFLAEHPSSVEGRVLAARQRLAAGDRASARVHLDAALESHKGAPRFRRRLDRRWAWRARAMLRRVA